MINLKYNAFTTNAKRIFGGFMKKGQRLYTVNVYPLGFSTLNFSYGMTFYETHISAAFEVASFYRNKGCLITIRSKFVANA